MAEGDNDVEQEGRVQFDPLEPISRDAFEGGVAIQGLLAETPSTVHIVRTTDTFVKAGRLRPQWRAAGPGRCPW